MFTPKTIMTASFCLLFAFIVSEGKAEDPENLDLAVTLVGADGSAFVFDGVAQSLVQQQTQLILSQHPKLDPATLERFITIFLEELTKQKADLLHVIAGRYATHCAREDLQGLVLLERRALKSQHPFSVGTQ